jgi:hypothetical protein
MLMLLLEGIGPLLLLKLLINRPTFLPELGQLQIIFVRIIVQAIKFIQNQFNGLAVD